MKKQRSNNKFLKIAAVSLALLALPPLAVYGQTVRCRKRGLTSRFLTMP